MTTFYNPYNFIPALPRNDDAGLGNGPPAGHDRWHRQLWSGRIAVTMQTVTPLLLVTARSVEGDPPGHHRLTVPTVDGDDGTKRVHLAPTQLKGMLRAAFEAVTNSRFGVVSKKHHQPLGYRSDAASGSKLRPVIVQRVDDRPRVTILGDLKPGAGLDPVPGAVLEGWQHPTRESRTPTALVERLHHGQHVEARLAGDTVTTGNGQQIFRWRVTDAVPVGDTLPEQPTSAAPWAHVRGYLHLTGPSIEGKRWERLFVTELLASSLGVTLDEHRTLSIPDSQELLGRLRQLVSHQRGIHTGADRNDIWTREHPTGQPRKPWEYFGHEPGTTAWSRHLYDVTSQPAGTPPAPGWTGPDVPPDQVPPHAVYTCWAETNGDRLRPVMVSRLLYDRSPIDLLHKSLRPAETLDELSPADRVFGWVAPRGPREGSRRAHRGQVRVVKVTAPAVTAETVTSHPDDSKFLPTLSSPKPSQGRFYLGREGHKGPQPLQSARAAFFGPQQTLRGRKVYLYRRGVRDEQVTPSGVHYDTERSTQNNTLLSWVNAGVEFSFELVVDNLTDLELGALLWLLDPARLGQDGNPGRHRLGMGKPYGFGVVELSLAAEGTALARGDQIAQRLTTLDPGLLDDPVWQELAERFEQAVAGPLAPALRAVRAAAAGVGAKKQIQYPRNRPQDDGYTWFVDEDRVAGKGQAQALPLLEGPAEHGTLKPSEGRRQ